MSPHDPMRGWIDSFPEMLAQARLSPASRFELDECRFVLVGGMGGSGIAGALAVSLLQREGRRVVAWRDPELPGWLSHEDRFVAVSYSGETWETAAMLEEAIGRGIPSRVIASGGSIASRAEASGIPLFTVPGGMAPRAALPWLLGGVLRALGADEEERIEASARLLCEERDTPPSGRDPKSIAESIAGGIACLIGVGPAMETVAIRWRAQIMENAEQFAIVSPLPEMGHNEVMGWGFLGDAGIRLRCWALVEATDPTGRYGRILPALQREAARSGHHLDLVPPPAGEGLAALLAQVYLGDRVSIELAERRGVAATPVEAISRMRAMAGKESSR